MILVQHSLVNVFVNCIEYPVRKQGKDLLRLGATRSSVVSVEVGVVQLCLTALLWHVVKVAMPMLWVDMILLATHMRCSCACCLFVEFSCFVDRHFIAQEEVADFRTHALHARCGVGVRSPGKPRQHVVVCTSFTETGKPSRINVAVIVFSSATTNEL